MARGVLNGIRMLRRPPYPTRVTSNFDEALAWTVPHLGGGVLRASDLPTARLEIERERRKAEPPSA
jgi:hypothetical protein